MNTHKKQNEQQVAPGKIILILAILFFAHFAQAKQQVSASFATESAEQMISAIESLSTEGSAGINNERYLFPMVDAGSAFITTDVQSNIDVIKPIATKNFDVLIDSEQDL